MAGLGWAVAARPGLKWMNFKRGTEETGEFVCDNIWYLEGGVGTVSTVDTYVGHGVGRGVRVQQQVDDLRVSLLRCLQSVTC